jgi:hypothetical protein
MVTPVGFARGVMRRVDSFRRRRPRAASLALASMVLVLLVPMLRVAPASASGALQYTATTRNPISSRTTPIAEGGVWSDAYELPGTSELNVGGNAGVNTISCTASQYCSVGGSYEDASGHTQAFVATETDNLYSPAIEVPGTATLNAGGNAFVSSISCSSAGNCGAGGSYTDSGGDVQGFVVSETNGTWSNALEVVDPLAKSGVGSFGVSSISCTATGSCTAVGEDLLLAGSSSGYALSESGGTWSDAIDLSFASGVGGGGTAMTAVSCTSPGNCGAVGNGVFNDTAVASGYAYIPYEADEINGSWTDPIQFPGLTALNAGENASAYDISCSSSGNCSAGGNYSDGTGTNQAFVDAEVSGAWGTAFQLYNINRISTGASTVYSISCTSFGNCGATGVYTAGSQVEVFVAEENEGQWLDAQELPGSSLFVNGTAPITNEISCSLSGACAAAGFYVDGDDRVQAYVVYEINHIWGEPVEVPGTIVLNTGGAAATVAISCSADSACGAGGFYTDTSSNIQAFVTNMTPLFSAQMPILVTSTHTTLGRALKLMATGGSGAGVLVFSVVNGTAKGCAISPTNTLSASTPGTCLVTASKGNDGTYIAASSRATPVSFSVPPRPAPLTINFAANSSALSSAARIQLSALSKKLIKDASLLVTVAANGNATLAKDRATEIVKFLSGTVAVHVTEKVSTSAAANTATIATTKQ